ncbi:MAG: T9SS type A sorting domain-containing protein, partial [Bacteroidota bacterium]
YYCVVTGGCDGTTQKSGISGAMNVNPTSSNFINSQSTGTQTICLGSSFSSISVTATGTNLTYQWFSNTTASTTGGTNLGLGAQSSTYTPDASVVGTLYYYCVVTGGCDGTTQKSGISGAMNVNPTSSTFIASQSTAAQTICIGNSFNPISLVLVGTNKTYQWYSNTVPVSTGGNIITGAINSAYTPDATSVGVVYYYCVVTTDCGTAASPVSGAFTVNPLPTASLSGTTSICYGATTNLTMTLTGLGPWNITYTDGTTQTTITGIISSPKIVSVSPNATSTYSITAVSDANCFGNSFGSTATITVNPLPVPVTIASPDTICKGLSSELSTSGGVNYTWYSIPPGYTSNVYNPTVSPTITTQYLVQVTDGNGCLNTSKIDVVVNNLPTISAGNDVTICNGADTTLNASGGVSYVWSPASSLSNNLIYNPIASPTVTTVYNVVAYSAQGCSGTDNVAVSVSTILQPDVSVSSPSAFCVGLNNSVTLYGPSGYTSYEWSNGLFTQNITVNQVGSFTLTVSNANGCESVSQVVNIINAPAINPVIISDGPSEFCQGENIVLSTDELYSTYLWSSGSTTSSIYVFESGSYSVTVTDSYGCQNTANGMDIIVDPLPVVNFSYNDSSLFVDFYNYSFFGTTYAWDFGDGTNSTLDSPTHNYQNSGVYNVVLTASNTCGTDTDSLEIILVDNTGVFESDNLGNLKIYPNPTVDYVNVELNNTTLKNPSITVYDIFGKIMSENQYLINRDFTTKISLQNLPTGVYLIKIQEGEKFIFAKIVKE